MKRFLCLAVAFVAAATIGASEAEAQCCNNNSGFNFQQFGYNFNNSGFERPPHFALFPPVYYSDQIVRRPVGISPFAATPGIVPAELKVHSEPTMVQNPYFKQLARPVTSGRLDTGT